MKEKRLLSALAIGAFIGVMTLGVQANAASTINIDGNDWKYGNAVAGEALYTSNTRENPTAPIDSSEEDYFGWVRSDEPYTLDDTINLSGTGKLTTNNLTQNAYLNAENGTIVVNGGALDIKSTSSIANAVTLTLNTNSTLKITGGTVYISDNDNISSGIINATAGNLTISGGTHTIGSTSSIGEGVTTFAITGGNVTFTDATNTISKELSNAGTVQLDGGTLSKSITGDGSTVINGTVTSSASIATAGGITINSEKSLEINADNVDAAVDNDATNGLILTGGNLAQNVSGDGSTKITGEVTINDSANSIAQGINIVSGGSLTANAASIGGAVSNAVENGLVLNGGNLAQNVTGDGSTQIAGTVTINDSNNYIQQGINIASGSLTANAASIKGAVDNDATNGLVLNGGNLAQNVTGDGSTQIAGTVTINDSNNYIQQGINIASGSLTANAASIKGAVSNAVENGLVLTGGDLEQNVSGGGTVKIFTTGTVTNDAAISQGVFVDKGEFVNNASASVSGATTVDSDASATNKGSMAAVTNSGTFINQGAGTTGAITNYKTLTIEGTGTAGIASVTNSGANSSATQSAGKVVGSVTNEGTYTLSGSGEIGGLVTNSGTFNLKNDKVTQYRQSTGSLNITDGGSLTLSGATNKITGGNVTLGSTTPSATIGTLIVANGQTDNSAVIVTNNASVLDIQNGVIAATGATSIGEAAKVTIGSESNNGGLTLTSGSLTLDGTNDTWNEKGTVTVSDTGALSLKGVTQNGTFTQTNGSTTIDADQTLTSNTTITGGNLYITGGNLTVNGENAVIGSGATINLASTKTLYIQNTKTTGTPAGITFNSGDTWAGAINQSGGLLTLSGRNDSTSTTGTGTYSQTAGTLAIDNGGSLQVNNGSSITENSIVQLGNSGNTAGTLILNNGAANQAKVTTVGNSTSNTLTVQGKVGDNATKLTLADGSDIEYGTVTVGDDDKNANILTMAGDTNGSKIASAVTMVIKEKATVNMTGSKADLTINSGDTWNGIIDQDAGTLTILNNNYTKGAAAYIDSDGGIIKIGDGSTAGTLSLANANDDIAKATQVTIYGDSTLTMSNGNVILDSASGSADTWLGAISLTGADAKLTLTGREDSTSTTNTGTYSQTAGTLTIDEGGSLQVNNGSSITENSIVQLGNSGNTAGTLILNNGSANQAKVTTVGTSTSNALTVQGKVGDNATKLTLADGSDIEYGTVTVGDDDKNANVLTMAGDTNGSKIARAVTMVIKEKAAVNMTGSKADLTINSGDTWNGQIDQSAGTLTVLNDDYTRSTGYLTSTNGKIVIGDVVSSTPVPGTLKLNNKLDSVAEATAVEINTNGILQQSAGTVALNASGTGADTWDGAIDLSGTGDLSVKDFTKVTDGTVRYNQTGGKVTFNHTDLELAADASKPSAITDGSVALTNGSTLTVSNGLGTNKAAVTMAADTETLNVKGGTTMTLDKYTYDTSLIQTSATQGNINVGDSADNTDHSTLAVASGTIAKAVTATINEGSALNITGAGAVNETTPGAGDAIVASVTLDGADTWNGDINLSNASTGPANDKNISLTLSGVTKTTGDKPTFDNTGSSPYYSQTGGSLYLTNNTTLSMADSSKINGGELTVDTSSTYNSLSNAFSVKNLTNAGLINGINGGYENYAVSQGIYAGDNLGDKQGDFTTDLYARSNTNKNYDSYGSESAKIYASDASKHGILNISDWTLNGDIFGYDAPIDRNIKMDRLFKGTVAANHTIDFTSTDKEVFTPIGWYALNSKGGGNYSFDLMRFNDGAFRGQVTKLAQYQNQLAIDDMLFNHTMLDQGFKGNDYVTGNPNQYASANDVFAPYQYSRKDGGLWVKMYGNFERLHAGGMDVGNNAYGTIIGADFGLKDLKHGWQFMPTAYVGYNGAHQYWSGYGAYQNGAQLGFMGTFYKNNFIIGTLAYGGFYGNEMSTPRGNDQAFNYFAGGAVKTAYNWKIKKNWALQPNFLVAYNFFGQENWHTDFGQMGMMSGMLHGINIAPGLNLIYERETWSTYLTIQYMYNINQAVGGRAGNVDLPRLSMDRGYLQYGIGINKKFSDRFSGYFQTVIRNVGRNGVGLQLGFQWKLGKGGKKTTQGNITPELKKTLVTINGNRVQ